MKSVRRYYQVFFLALFGVLTFLAAQGRLKGYPVTLLLDSSALNGLGALLSSWNVAHTIWLGFGILALTAVFGRFFCGWLCPLGTLFHVTSWLFEPRGAKARIERNRYVPAQVYKYLLLIGLLVCATWGVLQVGWFDPIALLTRSTATFLAPLIGDAPHVYGRGVPVRTFQGTPLIAGVFIGLLLLNAYRPRFWCRYICPLGALLGLAARWLPFGIRRDAHTCTNCGLCESVCPAACSPSTTPRQHECFMCWTCIARCPEQSLSWGVLHKQPQVLSAPDLTRRMLLGALGSGVAAVAALRLPGLGRGRGTPALIRPPGALAEADFLERCLKCGQCMKVCPTNVLQPALTEAGVEGLLTPVLNMAHGYCELNCTLCGQVCPTGAIRRMTIAEKLGAPDGKPLKLGTAFFDRGRCLPWAMMRNCLVCQEVCPVSPKAIYTLDEEVQLPDGTRLRLRRPDVDPAKCIGCGLCQHECPLHDRPAIRVSAVGESRAGAGFYL
jgi:polyferredoxin